MFADASQIRREVAGLFRPPRKIKVPEFAEEHLVVGGAGGYEGPWLASRTPYLVAPMLALEERENEAVVFVGPAQSGKTESLIGAWFGYSVIEDPADMMIVQSSQNDARDFSHRRIDRLIKKSAVLRNAIGAGNDDNVFDKTFKNGVIVNLAWPTSTQLSGKPVRRIALTDYDRFPLSLSGEGDGYAMAKARTRSFMSRGKILVETSPGHEVLDPEEKVYRHQSPKCHGALSLYNLGSRHRLYWPCPECGDMFLADWENLKWNTEIQDPDDAADSAHMVCTSCASVLKPSTKSYMLERCDWISEAERFNEPRKCSIASYWMQGPAVAFQTWGGLVKDYLLALRDYELTGGQEKLKTVTNTGLGLPYRVLTAKGDGLDSVILMQRATDYAPQRKVPAAARFVTTGVDVQKHRFVVSVVAWGEHRERWIVDRFNLAYSDRLGEGGERLKVSPFTHPEDWNVLDKLLHDEYEIVGTTATVKSKMIVCDSGGEGESTLNSYGYATRLKRMGLVNRFALVKGGSTLKAPRVAKGKPGDDKIKVPLWIINVTIFKDELFSSLSREEPGPDYIHLPAWAGEWMMKELAAERKGPDGRYRKLRKSDPNEQLDLMNYNALAYSLVGGEKINWKNPPEWAAKPLGEAMPAAAKVQPDSNENYLKFLRERGKRMNGE